MPNLNFNRMNVTATSEQINAVKAALQTINTNLPFLTGLTPEERITLPSINVSNKIFTEDAINAGINNPTLIPSYVSVAHMQNDLTLFQQLDELIILTKQTLEKLEDTQLLAGNEAYTSALAVYKLFASAAEAGVPGADTVYGQLRERFAQNGSSARNANTTASN